MSEGYAVDSDQARAATDALSCAPGQLWTAHNRSHDVAGLKNQAKWGGQPAPLAFLEAYASRLTETASDLELLREQFRDYVPPSILDRDDPRWSASHVPDGFEDRAGTSRAGMLVGGVLGAGASALAARGAASGLSGLSGLSLSGSGAAGLVGRVPGTGMLGTGSLSSTVGSASAGAGSPTSAGIAGQTGAGQSGAGRAGAGQTGAAQTGRVSPVTGAGRLGTSGTAPVSTSSTSTAGSGTQASSASRGMMAPHAGGSGQGRDRDRATLVGYDVQRLDDGSPQEHTAGDSAAAGSASALTPLHSEDSGEEW